MKKKKKERSKHYRISKTGRPYYCYRKKKSGPKVKRGPKPKKKKKTKVAKKSRPSWNFKIAVFEFKKQKKFIGYYHDAVEANYVKSILEEKNRSVVFPKHYVNNSHTSNKLYEFKNEYVILQKNKDELSDGITQLRNEFGKLVDHKTTNKNWMIYDKFPCLVEEKFWVYGYNPKTDRKEFNWIYENFVTNMLNSTDYIIITLFYNKIVFKYDNDINLVICKNKSDGVFMYNLIEERSKKNKQIIMTGYTTIKSDRGRNIENLIIEKTGWEPLAIERNSTRH